MEWIDFIALWIGRLLMIGGGLAAFMYVVMLPIDYVYRQSKAVEAFFQFLIRRDQFEKWYAQEISPTYPSSKNVTPLKPPPLEPQMIRVGPSNFYFWCERFAVGTVLATIIGTLIYCLLRTL